MDLIKSILNNILKCLYNSIKYKNTIQEKEINFIQTYLKIDPFIKINILKRLSKKHF